MQRGPVAGEFLGIVVDSVDQLAPRDRNPPAQDQIPSQRFQMFEILCHVQRALLFTPALEFLLLISLRCRSVFRLGRRRMISPNRFAVKPLGRGVGGPWVCRELVKARRFKRAG